MWVTPASLVEAEGKIIKNVLNIFERGENLLFLQSVVFRLS